MSEVSKVKPTAVRDILPLASFTAIGMLATDLYLPAVPMLPRALGGTIAEAQLTLASCLFALAISQILWGWACDRHGEARVLRAGILLLGGSSLLGAFAPNLPLLIIARAFQGFGAGAATAAVPALLSKRFRGPAAVRGIAIVGTAESIVPAIGPLLGTIVIAAFGWRATFAIIAVLTVALVPSVTRVLARGESGPSDPNASPLAAMGFFPLLKNRAFLRPGLAYAALFGALVLFVSAAPQFLSVHFPERPSSFSIFQIAGVASFMVAATFAGGFVERIGSGRLIAVGSILQVGACALLLGESRLFLTPSLMGIASGWGLFCAGLGLNGPASMGAALRPTGAAAGKASGLLMFVSFGLASVGTAFLGPYLERGLLPAAAALACLTAFSICVRPRWQRVPR